MQLLGKSDPSTDESETLADRWKNYIGSYVLVSSKFCSDQLFPDRYSRPILLKV